MRFRLAAIRLATAASLALAGTPALAQPSSEWLAHGPTPGLVVGFRQAEGGSMIVERIPQGETVQNWTRMVTVQRFAGQQPLEQWLATFTTGLAQGCPGARTSRPVYSETEGRRSVAFRVDCLRNPQTGQPETFLIRAISGAAALHVAQTAFRHVPSAAEADWARGFLATVTLCSRDVATPACRARPD